MFLWQRSIVFDIWTSWIQQEHCKDSMYICIIPRLENDIPSTFFFFFCERAFNSNPLEIRNKKCIYGICILCAQLAFGSVFLSKSKRHSNNAIAQLLQKNRKCRGQMNIFGNQRPWNWSKSPCSIANSKNCVKVPTFLAFLVLLALAKWPRKVYKLRTGTMETLSLSKFS